MPSRARLQRLQSVDDLAKLQGTRERIRQQKSRSLRRVQRFSPQRMAQAGHTFASRRLLQVAGDFSLARHHAHGLKMKVEGVQQPRAVARLVSKRELDRPQVGPREARRGHGMRIVRADWPSQYAGSSQQGRQRERQSHEGRIARRPRGRKAVRQRRSPGRRAANSKSAGNISSTGRCSGSAHISSSTSSPLPPTRSWPSARSTSQ